MKLTARKDITLDDDYVDVRYRELTPSIYQIFQLCENTSAVLLCEKDDTTYKVDVNDILYIETVDRKSYVYTNDEVLFSPTPLSQLEEELTGKHFVRISRVMIVNIFKIRTISSRLNYRLTAEMSNGEKVLISRHYRSALEEAVNELAKELDE